MADEPSAGAAQSAAEDTVVQGSTSDPPPRTRRLMRHPKRLAEIRLPV